MERKPRLIRVLGRAEELGLIFSFLLLILVEAGYVVWLQWLPALPAQQHSDPFLLMPPWYRRPGAEVMLLLTLVGGVIGWAGLGLARFLATSRSPARSRFRAVAVYRIKMAAFYAFLVGAYMLSIHILRS